MWLMIKRQKPIVQKKKNLNQINFKEWNYNIIALK